jgi:Tfp pilus assembly major pilin PilA
MNYWKSFKGFTVAELATTMGVIALAATILTPAVSGTFHSSVEATITTVSESSAAGKTPVTPPVTEILVTITSKTTGITLTKSVDPDAKLAEFTGLDAQADYDVTVVKRNNAGKGAASAVEIGYGELGTQTKEKTRDIQADDTTKPIYAPDTTKPIYNGYYRRMTCGSYGYFCKWSHHYAGASSYNRSYDSIVGYENKIIGYDQKTVVETYLAEPEPIMKAVGKTAKIKAPAGQLIIKADEGTTPTRSKSWATGTIVSKGAGTSSIYVLNDKVDYRLGTPFTVSKRTYSGYNCKPDTRCTEGQPVYSTTTESFVRVPALSYLVR